MTESQMQERLKNLRAWRGALRVRFDDTTVKLARVDGEIAELEEAMAPPEPSSSFDGFGGGDSGGGGSSDSW